MNVHVWESDFLYKKAIAQHYFNFAVGPELLSDMQAELPVCILNGVRDAKILVQRDFASAASPELILDVYDVELN